jgi:catechol 2,3-dioxygenase-like lactoylglutathione lyase family enzyme
LAIYSISRIESINMNFSLALLTLALATGASAFAPASKAATSTALNLAKNEPINTSQLRRQFLFGGLAAATSSLLIPNSPASARWFTPPKKAPPIQMNPNPLGLLAISHIAINTDDTFAAADYDLSVLGFELAYEGTKPVSYKDYNAAEFCYNAGFAFPDDGEVACNIDLVWLKHPITGNFLELITYKKIPGKETFATRGVNDRGGVSHIALEVIDAKETYRALKAHPRAGGTFTQIFDKVVPCIGGNQKGPCILPDDGTVNFFYWIDRYGVQWEFESGRKVGENIMGAILG